MKYTDMGAFIVVHLNKREFIDLVARSIGMTADIAYSTSRAPNSTKIIITKECVPERFKNPGHMLEHARTEQLFKVLEDFRRRMKGKHPEAKTAGVFCKAIERIRVFDEQSTLEDLLIMPSSRLHQVAGLGERRIGLFQKYLNSRGYYFIEQ